MSGSTHVPIIEQQIKSDNHYTPQAACHRFSWIEPSKSWSFSQLSTAHCLNDTAVREVMSIGMARPVEWIHSKILTRPCATACSRVSHQTLNQSKIHSLLPIEEQQDGHKPQHVQNDLPRVHVLAVSPLEYLDVSHHYSINKNDFKSITCRVFCFFLSHLGDRDPQRRVTQQHAPMLSFSRGWYFKSR